MSHPWAMSLRAALADLLAPPSCLRCGVQAALPWCRPCRAVVERLRWDGRVRVPGLDRVDARFRYQDEVADAVVRGKLRGVHAVWRPLGAMLHVPPDIDVVVPVPTDRRRRRARGFDHTMLLASGLAEVSGLPVLSALSAPRGAVDRGQAGTGPAVARSWGVRARLDGAHVLVVDDVVTTGTTLAEVAAACREAGAARVRGSVIGATPRPERFGAKSAHTAERSRRVAPTSRSSRIDSRKAMTNP